MKQLILSFLTWLFLLPLVPVFCQQNIVMLVDVSASIPKYARQHAREVVKDILTGKPISDPMFYYDKYPQSSLDLTASPLIGNGSHIIMIPFGERNTSDKNAEQLVSNYPTDLFDFLDAHYPSPTDYHDQFTYLALAKAKAAQVAKEKGMSKVMLLVISDNINDFTGGNSPNYSTYEQQLVDNYNSQSNPVTEGAIEGYVRLRGEKDFKIPIRGMDVSMYQPVNNPSNPVNKPIPPPPPAPPAIAFTGPLSGATRVKPATIKSAAVNISWLCKNCPGNTVYNVVVNKVDGGKFKDAASRNIGTPSVMKNLEDGTYKITVSGDAPAANTLISGATTYVTVDAGGGAGWLWLLLLLLLVGAGIYWNRERQKKKIREAGKEQGSILDNPIDKNSYQTNEF